MGDITARRVDPATLSDGAKAILCAPWFQQELAGHPILAAPRAKWHEVAFAELLDAGFVHGDVERGVFGYRSTLTGRDAARTFIRAENARIEREKAARNSDPDILREDRDEMRRLAKEDPHVG